MNVFCKNYKGSENEQNKVEQHRIEYLNQATLDSLRLNQLFKET